jgi:hypothetical protein
MPPYFTLSAYGYLLGLGFLTDVVVPAYWLLVALTIFGGAGGAVALGWAVYIGARCAVTARATRRVAACPLDPPLARLAPNWERRVTEVATAALLLLTALSILTSQ